MKIKGLKALLVCSRVNMQEISQMFSSAYICRPAYGRNMCPEFCSEGFHALEGLAADQVRIITVGQYPNSWKIVG
jgi:hypothetical protein